MTRDEVYEVEIEEDERTLEERLHGAESALGFWRLKEAEAFAELMSVRSWVADRKAIVAKLKAELFRQKDLERG